MMSDLIATLSPEEVSEIEHEIGLVPRRDGAAIDALLIVQKHRGWVSDESLKAIAGLLEMSAEELEGIATFYNLVFRKPVGDKVILLCDSVSCWLRGYEDVKARIPNTISNTFYIRNIIFNFFYKSLFQNICDSKRTP